MSSNRKYQILLVISVIVLIIIEINAPKPVNWRQTFSRLDKVPYGSYLLFEELETLFPGQKIRANSAPIVDAMNELYAGDFTNLIFVNNFLTFDEVETDELFGFVEEGGHVFAAASQFRGAFRDSLQLSLNLFGGLEDSLSSHF